MSRQNASKGTEPVYTALDPLDSRTCSSTTESMPVGRWQIAEQLIDDALTFWRNFFETYGPPMPAGCEQP